MPVLRIQLLGGFAVEYGDAPLPGLGSPRLQALLAHLVLHRSTPQSRQQLAFLFWPDTTEAQARANLRYFLHRLRHTLPESEHFLQAGEQSLAWNVSSPYTLDVAGFEEALAGAGSADAHVRRAALERAVDLYRGDLLPGCYDDWILPERERLRQAQIAALEQLLQLLEEQGEYRAATARARELLRYDPLHEPAYRRLMRLCALSGDRVGALRAYHTCFDVLARELGVEPGEETRAEYERLLRDARQAPDRPQARAAAAQVPLRVPDAPPHNLPLALSSFVGRQQARAEVARLLATERAVTLTGPGGCGKTRLALEVAAEALVAHEYTGGVWWVDLATLSEPGLVAQAAASAVGMRESGSAPMLEALTAFLQPRTVLLVLDNCEHLIDACTQLAEGLLRACPHLHVMATSREPMHVAGEAAWPVPPLTLPTANRESEALTLFVERATAALPTFELTAANLPTVADLCRRLDGLPLAIELAAARVKALSVEQILARLDDRFTLLKSRDRGAAPRHRSLAAALDWSYELLAEDERALYGRLSVFAGGFTLDALEAVCAGEMLPAGSLLELLVSLVDKSFVVAEHQDGATRYRLLETLRVYARERLRAAGDEPELQVRHAAHFRALAAQAAPRLRGPEQRTWLERLAAEHDNLRAALTWASHYDVAGGLELAATLERFWLMRGHWTEGRQWLARLLDHPAAAGTRARALLAAASLAYFQQDLAPARAQVQAAQEIAERLDDPRLMAAAWDIRLMQAVAEHDLACARQAGAQALRLFRDLHDAWGTARILYPLGHVALYSLDLASARRRYRQCLERYRRLGDRRGAGLALNNLGLVERRAGDYARARAYFADSLETVQALGDTFGITVALGNLAEVAYWLGDLEKARAQYADCLAQAEQLGDRTERAQCLIGLGRCARQMHADAQALDYFEAGVTMARQAGREDLAAVGLLAIGRAARERGDLPTALQSLQAALLAAGVNLDVTLKCLAALAGMLAALGEPGQAAQLCGTVDALLAARGERFDPFEASEYERDQAVIRDQLGEPAFAAAHIAGGMFTLEQARDAARAALHRLANSRANAQR